MADRGLQDSPIVPALDTEAVLTATPTVTAPEAELGYSTDTKLMWFRRAAQGIFRPIVEYWRRNPTITDAAMVGSGPIRLVLRTSAPANAWSIRFSDPGGSPVNLWLVAEDA